MAFQLKPTESVRKGVQRIVSEQIDAALDEIANSSGQDEAVHEVRKRLKKIRGLARLVRRELGDPVYRRENESFRDTGRPLTEVRDAQVLIATLGKLRLNDRPESEKAGLAALRQGLVHHGETVRKRVLDDEKTFDTVRALLEDARKRIDDWKIQRNGWSAVGQGVKQAYKKSRRGFAAALAEPSVENLHEWRKQSKYLLHQLQVLAPPRAKVLNRLADEVHKLTGLLGDDHDLAMLGQTITADADAFGGAPAVEILVERIRARRGKLQRRAFALGRRFFRAEPPDFLARIKDRWKSGRNVMAK